MSKRRDYCIWLIIALSLSIVAPAQEKSDSPTGTQSEEAAISEAIKNYYAAYAAKNLPAVVKMWSERSPDFFSSIQEMSKAFEAEDRAFSNVAVSRVRVAANKAVVKVEADAAVTDPRTKTSRHEKLNRSLALIKEGGGWKVWRDAGGDVDLSAFLERGSEWKAAANSVEQFATVLANAKSEGELNQLLADNKEMMTARLRDALMRRARQLEAQLGYRAAISLFRIAQEISARLGDKRAMAEAHRGLANSYRLTGANAMALENYQAALRAYESLNDTAEKAATLSEMGTVYFAGKKYREAIETYERALKEYEALNDKTGVANAFEEIGSVYYDQERYDIALEFFQRSLALRESRGTEAEVAAMLASIGNVYFQQQDYNSAITNYRKALAGFEAIDHREAIAGVTSNLGSAHLSQGDYEAALNYFQKAFRLEEQLRNRLNMADALANIAKAYSALGNYGLALDSLHKGLAHFEAIRDRAKTSGTLAEIGEARSQIRDYDGAIESYQKSLALYLAMQSGADAGTVLAEIGNAQFSKGDYERAIESYQKAITHYEAIKHPAGVASLLGSIAGAHYSQARLDFALEFYQKSLAGFEALGDRPRVAATLERMASVYYSQADYGKSLEVAARAGSAAEQIQDSDTLWRVRLVEAMDYRALNQTDKAARGLEQSISIIEAMRERVVRGEASGRFFQSKAGAYTAMLDLLMAQGRVGEAFDYAERIKMNRLWDMLQSGGVRITKTMAAQEQGQERRLESEIVSLKSRIRRERERKQPDGKRLADFNGRLQKAIADYRAFESRLYGAHPQLKALRGEAAPIKIEQATRLIESDKTALVEFVVADARVYLFVLTRETPAGGAAARRPAPARPRAPSFTLNVYAATATTGEIAERVNRFRAMIGSEGEDVRPLARELYDLLLKPAGPQLADRSEMIVVPDSFLWHLPFQALQPGDDHYLVEDCTISYAPSLTALGEMTGRGARANRAIGATLLAVGNPAISKQTMERVRLAGDEKLDPSPATEGEVRAIEQIYGAGRSKVLTGAQASEEAVKREAAKFKVIHLAAPALFGDASPAYSHVALSSSEENGKEDGLLEAWEIAKQTLAAEIVVLSSSETTRASVATGEAMVAVSWAFLIAGCPASVSSQWKVDAPASTDLMAEFHRNIKERATRNQRPPGLTGFTTAQALRQAALKLLRGNAHKHPRYWAAFRLIGDWQ